MLVEDDQEIRDLVEMYLKTEAYTVLGLDSGSAVADQLGRFQPDLIIMDVLLPDINGIELCKYVRGLTDASIIYLSCLPSNHYIIAGLEAGGDDYMVKPFDPAVLMARVKAHLRRTGKLLNASVLKIQRYGDLEIHLESMEVFLGGQRVHLYSKELQLLLFFIENPNIVFNAQQLYEQIWKWKDDGDERTVMVHISNLRTKLKSEVSDSPFIQTVRGFGYKFVPAYSQTKVDQSKIIK
jgi:two-component system alkaline phosphatase synthesis response regulator PhoP